MRIERCSVACMLFLIRKKQDPVQSIYKVHIQSPYIRSSSKIHCIYHISFPPSKVFLNVCMLRQIESGDFVHEMNDEHCLDYLLSRHCLYYFIYCLNVYFLYSFLHKQYYRYLNGHRNH